MLSHALHMRGVGECGAGQPCQGCFRSRTSTFTKVTPSFSPPSPHGVENQQSTPLLGTWQMMCDGVGKLPAFASEALVLSSFPQVASPMTKLEGG